MFFPHSQVTLRLRSTRPMSAYLGILSLFSDYLDRLAIGKQQGLPTYQEMSIKMVANIETFASFRQPAWHGLGTVFDHEVKNADEMLALAGLANWNLRVEELPLPAGYDAIKPQYAVVRDNPFTDDTPEIQANILGYVGKNYTPFQNEQAFELAQGIVEADPTATWETAGSLAGGTRVFGSLALERETVLDPSGVSDVIKTYLLVATSHDGTLAVTATVTPTRVVCANTLAVALQGATTKFRMKHTPSVTAKVAEARETLGMAHKYMDAFDEMAKALFETEITNAQFAEIINLAYVAPEFDVKGSQKKYDDKVDLIWDTYRGQYNDTITGTAWGAWNGLTETLDWKRNGRGDNGAENILAGASGFDQTQNDEKARLLSIVKQVAFA